MQPFTYIPPMIRGCALAALLGAGFQAHASQIVAREILLREPPGPYVLELEAPSSLTRGECVSIGLSSVEPPVDATVQLVARLPGFGSDRPVGTYLKRVAAAAGRSQLVPICRAELQPLARTSHDEIPPVVEVAVFRIPVRSPVISDWSDPWLEELRVSAWLPLPDSVWRTRPGQPVGPRARNGRSP